MSHVFVWSEQDGWIWWFCIAKGLDGELVETMVSQAIMCQFLFVVVVNDLPMSEKRLTMGKNVFLCGVRWDNKLLNMFMKPFLCS